MSGYDEYDELTWRGWLLWPLHQLKQWPRRFRTWRYMRRVRSTPEWQSAVDSGQFNALMRVVYPDTRLDTLSAVEPPFLRYLTNVEVKDS